MTKRLRASVLKVYVDSCSVGSRFLAQKRIVRPPSLLVLWPPIYNHTYDSILSVLNIIQFKDEQGQYESPEKLGLQQTLKPRINSLEGTSDKLGSAVSLNHTSLELP